MIENVGTSYSYVTLFDKGFMAIGIVMIDSFLKNTKSSRLYVLCMDDKVYTVLNKWFCQTIEKRVFLVTLSDFLTEEYEIIRQKRTRRAFSWTCSALSVKYVLRTYDEKVCTYIDADLFFYANPDDLVDELIRSGKSVQIIEHRFRMNRSGRKQQKESGRFCVEFNSFMNDNEGNRVLETWCNDVIKQCNEDTSQGLGDQFYLNHWPEEYDCVHILENKGAGIAPWNIDRYSLVFSPMEMSSSNKDIYIKFDKEGKYKAYFYHFTHISYFGNKININVFHRYFSLDKQMVYSFYIPYLKQLGTVKSELEMNYGHAEENPCIYANKSIEKTKPILSSVFYKFLCKMRELMSHNADFIDLELLNDQRSYKEY